MISFGSMMFPQLARFTDVALLLLRIMIGIVFLTSGWRHLTEAEKRSKDIGQGKGFTMFLGAAECAGSLGVIFGVLAQLAAAGLILIMLGANPEENLRLAHRFLGRIRDKRVELRHDARGDEPCYSCHRRWKSVSHKLVRHLEGR